MNSIKDIVTIGVEILSLCLVGTGMGLAIALIIIAHDTGAIQW